MPKKNQFSFQITGRKLFETERGAVNGFVKKYSAYRGQESAASVPSKHSQFENSANSSVSVVVQKRTTRPKVEIVGAKATKKVTGSALSAREIKAAIFGIPKQQTRKPTAGAVKQPVTKAGTKPASLKRIPPPTV